MEKAFASYTLKEKSRTNSERAELVGHFLTLLNTKDREKGGYKPLQPAFISSKLSQVGLKTNQDIYVFLNQCRNAKTPSAYFWWSINPRNVDKNG